MSARSTENGIAIRTMTKQDYDVVKPFLREQFYTGEPLCMSSGEDVEKSNEQHIDEYNLSLIEQGTSLVATDKTGSIVGLVLAGALYDSDVEKHRIEAKTLGNDIWSKILKFLSIVETEAKVFERYNVSKAIYSHITNVAESMRGKGLGTRLAAALMDMGREKGFPLMLAYCTSYYSARQKEAMGMECCHSQLYADYKDEQGHVVFNPPPPHTQLRIMVKKL